jgi:hypothetical protein
MEKWKLVFNRYTNKYYSRRSKLHAAGYTIPRISGFIVDNPRIFYYDETTKRHKILESKMKTEGYFFKPLSSRPLAYVFS